MMKLFRFATAASLTTVIGLATSQVALGFEESDASPGSDEVAASDSDATPAPAQTLADASPASAVAPHAVPDATGALPSALPSATTTAAAQAAAEPTAPSTFVSNGAPVRIDSLGINITPPAGWEVQTNTGSLSLVMGEPHDPRPAYDKPKYQRNITVAAIHQASPIDEARATQLAEELTRRFSADGSVSNFQVTEHKFFNYRGVNDGLLVYSSMNLGEYPMMQMHVLVSGKDTQFLLTYTDLAEQFTSAKDGSFEKAWNSIVSIEVTGETPTRQSLYLKYEIAGGVLLLLGLGAFLVRRRAGKRDFGREADDLIEGDDATGGDLSGSVLHTLAHGWRLGTKATDEISGIEFTGANQPLSGKTRQAEYVSNY